jgi:hypothetical protein
VCCGASARPSLDRCARRGQGRALEDLDRGVHRGRCVDEPLDDGSLLVRVEGDDGFRLRGPPLREQLGGAEEGIAGDRVVIGVADPLDREGDAGGQRGGTWISPIRYIEPFLRRRAFALSWRAVALMMTSARIPGSIRSTSVRAPRPAVARPLFTFACVAGSCAFAATALATFADASAAFTDASAAVFPAVASPLFTFSCVSGSWALADTAPAARADASPASRATADAFSFAFWRKLTRTSALASRS